MLSSTRRLSVSDSESARQSMKGDERQTAIRELRCSTAPCLNDAKRCRFRCSLMWTFAIVCGISVISACILIWWIEFRSTSNTVHELTTSLRASTLRDVLFKINNAMAQPLRCSHALRYSYANKFPDFSNRIKITNETGWLSDFTFINLACPSVIRMGIVNTHMLELAILRPASNTQEVATAASGELVIEIAEPANYSVSSVTLNQFVAQPIRKVHYFPPTNMVGEIFASDSVDDIRRFTGDIPTSSRDEYHPRSRPFYLAALELSLLGLAGGWSDPFFSIPSATIPGFMALAAVSVELDPVTNEMGFLAWSLISTTELRAIFAALDLGANGRSYLIRPKGRCAASSSIEITNAINQNQEDLSMQDGRIDPLMPTLYELLLQWRLVTNEYFSIRNISAVIDTRQIIHSRSIHFEGDSWTVEAQMLSLDITALPYSVVIVTRDADWDGNVRASSIRTIWISTIVCVVAILLAILVSKMVTRDLISIVHHMGQAVRIIEMERSEMQRQALENLCERWNSETNPATPIIKTSNLPQHLQVVRKMGGSTCWHRISSQIYETKLLQRAFGSVLHSLASNDELEAINQAKRQFIRYIFHEVRVPFNAIVLGIESMQMELKNIISTEVNFSLQTPTALQLMERRNNAILGLESCSDTLGILSEQSAVVSRILNDVLSMQKIDQCKSFSPNDLLHMLDHRCARLQHHFHQQWKIRIPSRGVLPLRERELHAG